MLASDLLRSFTLGTIANFPWEMAHSFLYRGVPGFTLEQHLVCCGLASVADGVAMAAIFGGGAALFRDPKWTRDLSAARLGVTMLLGLLGAVITEWLALHLGWWGYGPSMPRVPGTELGVSPLVQFVVLPLVVLFWALPRWWSHGHRVK
jgi:hypothetical protein